MIKKPKTLKSVFNGQEWERYFNLAIASKLPFTIRQSTYTMKIESQFINIQFMQNVQSENAFIGYGMIQRDIKEFGLSPPIIDRRSISYYKFAVPDYLKNTKHTIYNIDLKSAYAQSLFNSGTISARTHAYLSRIKKPDRLAAVGMLASNPNYYHHLPGEKEAYRMENKCNPLSDFFFNCALDIQRLIEKIINAIGKDFLFYWVDGIYFKSLENKQVIEKIIFEENFKCSFDTLTEFKVMESKRRYLLTFLKGDGERKIFPVSKVDLSVNKRLIDLLQLHSDKYSMMKNNNNSIII